MAVPPDTVASAAHGGIAEDERLAGSARERGDGSPPRTRSHEPRTNACGVPTSSQYADSA